MASILNECVADMGRSRDGGSTSVRGGSKKGSGITKIKPNSVNAPAARR